MIDGAGPGHDGQPGGQSGPRRVVGFQQPEILGAKPDEDVLRGVHDVFFAQSIGAQGAAHHGIDQRRGGDHERIPCAFIAPGQCPQVDLVQFSQACDLSANPPCSLTGFVAK